MGMMRGEGGCIRRVHTQAVTSFVLLSPFGELLLRRDVDLVLHAADLDDATQIARLPVDLYPLFEEGFLPDTSTMTH